MFKNKKLEKIAVSVFRCFAVSWFSNALRNLLVRDAFEVVPLELAMLVIFG